MKIYSRRDFICSIAGAVAAGMVPGSVAAAVKNRKIAKKGVGITMKDGSGWAEKLEKLNLDWHYSWGRQPKEGYPADVKFVPMQWGKWGIDKTVAYINEQKKLGKVDCLLGFNEPDGKDQANIPVDKAIELWPQLMKAEVRLGSPACVHPDNDWMKEFMAKADKKKLRIDFVTMHDYGGPSANGLVNKVKKTYEMYGRPVWITEFAVGDWKAKSAAEHKHKPKRVLEFMKEVLPALDKLDCLERYAWFPASQDSRSLGTSALFDKDGNLTELGEFFAQY